MKLVRILALVFAGWISLGLLADPAIGHFQPQSGNTAVLRSFDSSGGARQTVLGLQVDGTSTSRISP